MNDNKEKPVMQLVMGGKFAQQIICKGLPFKSEKEEDFYQVTDLYKSPDAIPHQLPAVRYKACGPISLLSQICFLKPLSEQPPPCKTPLPL